MPGEIEAALIGFGGAIIGGVLTALATYKSNQLTVTQQQIAEFAKLRLQHRMAQANSFYGPLVALRAASEQVYEQLRKRMVALGRISAPDDKFGLIDHLPDLQKDPIAAPLIGEILQLGCAQEALLQSNPGLVEGIWPASFSTYLGHIAILRAAATGANPAPGLTGSMQDAYFPTQLDNDIEQGYAVIRRDIGRIQDVARKQLRRSLNIAEEDAGL